MKVVINTCHGGFGLSQKAMERYAELKGFKLVTENLRGFPMYYADSISDENMISDYNIRRDDPDLVRVVEELGKDACSWAADLKIVEVPDDVNWEIAEYDGAEWVAECHRTWD